MPLDRFVFSVMYRLGVMPWDGHAMSARLRALTEGPERLPPGRALDLGCGTGDASIYLAQHGWQVTGVDFVERALAWARRKAAQAGVRVDWVRVDWVRGDVTRLDPEVGTGFQLAVDNGCLHGLSDASREDYVREVARVVSPGGRLLIVAFPAGARPRPRGISRDEIERRFAGTFRLVASGPDPEATSPDVPLQVYEMVRL
jgi:SAM-dependent methyltransferase